MRLKGSFSSLLVFSSIGISANAELSQENIHIIHYGEESNGWIGLHISFLWVHDALMVSLQE